MKFAKFHCCAALLFGFLGATLLAPTPIYAEPVVRVLLDEVKSARIRVVDPGDGKIRNFSVAAKGAGIELDGLAKGSTLLFQSASHIEYGGNHYRGRLRVKRVGSNLSLVNYLPLEQYVAGTLFREVYPGWKGEALLAQAVVVRTYALSEVEKGRGTDYDLRADTGSQVYGGIGAEGEQATEIVKKTKGEYLSYLGKPILAAYHATAGGRTASAAEVWGKDVPYLVSVAVEDEWESPDAYWRLQVSGSELARALQTIGVSVGELHSLRITERSPSGRVVRVKVAGKRHTALISGRELRDALGHRELKSTLFELRAEPGAGFVFVGSGYGHGVGMSQWGAQIMAERGASYREILAWFYPGTTLQRLH